MISPTDRPRPELADAGAPLALGTDQHAVVDPFEEARGLETARAARHLERGRFTPAELLGALTRHDAIGWPDAGRLAAGARADLVAVRLESARTAGATRTDRVAATAPTSTPWWSTGEASSAAAGTCSATSAPLLRAGDRRRM